MKKRLILLICGVFLWITGAGFGQNYRNENSNFLHEISEIEARLPHESFEIFRMRDLQYTGNITKRVILKFDTTDYMQVKWKRAPQGGEAFNNEPRYEVAAYEVQKLFLEADEYVVPPTVIRGLPFAHYKSIESAATPTFENPPIVFFALQYWLENVDAGKILDKERFESDSLYARHVGNLNIFCYLIRHSDANQGNFLISTIASNPRVYAVDNGVAFASRRSDRGFDWQFLRVDKLPASTVARLRKITAQDITEKLATLAQFEVQYGVPTPVAPTENLDPQKGVRRTDNIIQFGMTEKEIEGIVSRLAALLQRIDAGDISLF